MERNTLIDLINTYLLDRQSVDISEIEDEIDLNEAIDDSVREDFKNDDNPAVNFWNGSIKALMKAFDDNFAFDENGILNAANHILVGSGNNTITTNDLRNATAVYGNISPNNNGEEGGTFYNVMREGLPVSQLAEFNRDLVDNIHLQFTSEKGYGEPNGWTSLLMPQNSRRVNVIDLNKNFWIIGQVISGIIGEIMMDPSDPNLPSIKKNYLNMFQAFLNEYMQLWENVLYLWLLMMTQEKGATEKPIVKYVYLNESSLLMERKFDIAQKDNNPNITLEAVYDAIKDLAYEYPHSHLCVIPIIRCNNYYKNYYEEETYPGIFYHAPCLNRKIFKISKKFIFIPFSPYEEGDSRNVNFNPFTAHDFFRTGQISLYWACGYRIFKNHLYYMCPYSSIEQTKEIVPKRYYTAVSSHFNSGLSVVNGKLHFDEFIISYKDEVASAIDEREVTLASAAASGSAPIDIGTLGEEMYVDGQLRTDIIVRQPICFSVTTEQKSRRNLTKISNFRNRAEFKFNLYAGECISRFAESIEEDYSYLIEYVPFAHEQTVGENELIRDSSFSDLNSHVSGALKTKDNDLLEKHYAWDNERNNIIEDKFVLRIGQHIEADAVPAHNDLIPEEFRFNDKIQYFDYKSLLNHDIEEKETQSNVEFYNSGTIEVGAYLNIPFIKKESKRVTYYPDFLSHTSGSDNLIPLTSIEYFSPTLTTTRPEYFSYNKVFKDLPIKKDDYFTIFTSDGKETFDDDNWCIQLVEVVAQDTTSKDSLIDINTDFNFETAKSMDQLYTTWNGLSAENRQKLVSENIVPYLTQLCPGDASSESVASVANADLYNQIVTQYSDVVNYFYSNYTSEQKNRVYQKIFDCLFSTSINVDDSFMHLIHEKKISSSNDVTKKSIALDEKITQWGTIKEVNNDGEYDHSQTYDLKVQLGIIGTSLSNQESNDWEQTQQISSGMRGVNPNEYFEYFKPTRSLSWGANSYAYTKSGNTISWMYIDGDYNWSPSSEPSDNYKTTHIFLRYSERIKLGETTTTIHYLFYNTNQNQWIEDTISANVNNVETKLTFYIPNPQLGEKAVKKTSSDQYVYDETFKVKYSPSQNLIIGSKFFAAGFCCANRTIPLYSNVHYTAYTDPNLYENIDTYHHYEIEDSKVLRFEIFGTNLPMQTAYWDFPPNSSSILTPHYPRDDDYPDAHNYPIATIPSYFPINHNGTLLGPEVYTVTTARTSFLNPTNKVWLKASRVVSNYWLNQSNVNSLNSLDPVNASEQQYSALKGYCYQFNFSPRWHYYFYPLLKYNYIQKRQYPHIYLSSNKTLFPNKTYLINKEQRNIRYKNYKNTSNNKLKDYFSKLINESDLSNLPYPLPNNKHTSSYQKQGDTDWTTAECKQLIRNTMRAEVRDDFDNIFGDFDFRGQLLNVSQKVLGSWNESENTECILSDTRMNNDKIAFPSIWSYVAGPREYQTIRRRMYDLSYGWCDSGNLNITTHQDALTSDTYYTGTANVSADKELGYEQVKDTYSMNLQVIIHYFGPNGAYARKVMTRQITNNTLGEDKFTWNGNANALTYNEWTNDWKIDTFYSSVGTDTTTYTQFKNKIANLQIFKQSSSYTGLDFESYPNTGLSSEGSHTES